MRWSLLAALALIAFAGTAAPPARADERALPIDHGAAITARASTQTAAPQSGWWWNPNQSGRGYGIEIQGDKLFMAGFIYADNGRASWFTATGTMTAPTLFEGTMQTQTGGQTLTGSYVAPTAGAQLGAISLNFSDATHLTMTWPGGTTSLERFDQFTDALLVAPGQGQPQSGWWWNASESGRGYFLEIQGDQIFMTGFMYDPSGNPIWYVASGTMASTTSFSNGWQQVANGQTLTGPWQAATIVNSNVGSIALSFTDTTNATMTLPSGRAIALTRYSFGSPSISGVVDIGAPVASATVTAYALTSTGGRGTALGTATTNSDGRFRLTLSSTPAGAVELVATGGSYVSAYSGQTITNYAGDARVSSGTTSVISAAFSSVPGVGLNEIAITPISGIAAEFARTKAAAGTAYATALDSADQGLKLAYGLQTQPEYVQPLRGTGGLSYTARERATMGHVLGGMETAIQRQFPGSPASGYIALAWDWSDGKFDGKAGTATITYNGAAIPTDTGSTRMFTGLQKYASAQAAGLYPGYIDAQYTAGTVTESYTSSSLPVYVASNLSSYYTASAQALIPNAATPAPAGYSCSYAGVTLIYNSATGRYSCSDGTIAVYTAPTLTAYSAATIAFYNAGSVDPVQAPVVVGRPSGSTIPVYTATTNIHVFTEAERAAMTARTMAGYPSGGGSGSGGPYNALQAAWSNYLVRAAGAWYSGGAYSITWN